MKNTEDKLDSESGPELPKFSLKLRDYGRIPTELPKLNRVGKTAILPFTPFTRILQLRNSSNIPGAGQFGSKGHAVSRESLEVSGKEFFIPLNDDEFAKS